jgi:hypothetical protein
MSLTKQTTSWQHISKAHPRIREAGLMLLSDRPLIQLYSNIDILIRFPKIQTAMRGAS